VTGAEFLRHLLVPLLADPARLDVGGQDRQPGVLGVVGQVIPPLVRLTNQPCGRARQTLAVAPARTIGDARPPPTLGASTPRHEAPGVGRQRGNRLPDGAGLDRRHRVLGRATGRADGSGLERDVGGIDRLDRRNADRGAQPAFRQTGPELRHFAVFRIGDTAEHCPGGPDPVDFLQSESPLRLERDGQPTVDVRGPGLEQEQAQPDTDRHLAAGQGKRDRNLAVGLFAELPTKERSAKPRDALGTEGIKQAVAR